MTLVVAFTTTLNSTLVENLEMRAYFLKNQEIKLVPRKIQNPFVELQSSRQPVQSTSEKIVRSKLEERKSWRLKSIGVLKVAQYVLNSGPMRHSRHMHILTRIANGKCKIRKGTRQVLQ